MIGCFGKSFNVGVLISQLILILGMVKLSFWIHGFIESFNAGNLWKNNEIFPKELSSKNYFYVKCKCLFNFLTQILGHKFLNFLWIALLSKRVIRNNFKFWTKILRTRINFNSLRFYNGHKKLRQLKRQKFNLRNAGPIRVEIFFNYSTIYVFINYGNVLCSKVTFSSQ
jgi:hypothetical protein